MVNGACLTHALGQLSEPRSTIYSLKLLHTSRVQSDISKLTAYLLLA